MLSSLHRAGKAQNIPVTVNIYRQNTVNNNDIVNNVYTPVELNESFQLWDSPIVA